MTPRALQEDARRILTSNALPALEEVLASASDAHETVVLDRIELDLGRLSSDSFADQFVERLRSRLRDSIVEAVRRLRVREGHTPGAIVAEATFSLEVLRRFLLAGRMPWWVAGGARMQPQQLLLDALEREPRALALLLRALPPRSTSRRLVLQFDPAAVDRTIALLAEAHGDPGVARIVAEWLQLIAGPLPRPFATVRNVRERIREHAIELLLSSDRIPAAEAFCVELTTRLSRDTKIDVDVGTVLVSLAAAAGPALPDVSPLRRWLTGAMSAVERPHHNPPRTTGGAPATNRSRRRNPPAPHARGRAPERATESSRLRAAGHSDHGEAERSPAPTGSMQPAMASHATAVDAVEQSTTAAVKHEHAPPSETAAEISPLFDVADDEAIYVDDAGLVLVWPFLSRYFDAVGLVRDKCFTSPAARERAVLLLHYLATGTVEAPEQQLVLPKLLAGWREEDPVSRSIDVTDDERRESTDLLTSVVENLSALKGTSADGLRSAFLQREGKLARGGSGWELTVARAGYDVLLDRLPWGISLVVLPWMPQPLFVEW